jgi:hypothetical protein
VNGRKNTDILIDSTRIVMFDDLQEQTNRDEDATITPRQRNLRYAIALTLSVAHFGGCYFAITFLEF